MDNFLIVISAFLFATLGAALTNLYFMMRRTAAEEKGQRAQLEQAYRDAEYIEAATPNG